MKRPIENLLRSGLCVAALLTISTGCHAQNAVNDGKLHPGDRIVFIGDSITGQGGNFPNGWTHLLEEALAAVHPGETRTLTALGGSGQTVGSWTSIEKHSRDAATILDVKGVDVKATLDGGAEVVVIMLGMNDVLSPSLSTKPDAPDQWKAKYAELIAAVKARTHYRQLALATIPLCTEDPASPKNQMIDALDARLAELAKAENAVLLPVHEAESAALARGRQVKPDYHLTGDFVHPNPMGHVAIATGMLRGLGEDAAAKYLVDKYETPTIARAGGGWPSLSYAVRPKALPLGSDESEYQIQYWWTTDTAVRADLKASRVQLSAPEGWRVTELSTTPASGAFDVKGPLDHLSNVFKLRAGDGVTARETTITVPAPWLIGTGNAGGGGWINGNSTFDPEKGHLPVDDSLATGQGFGQPAELAPGVPLKWARYQSSVDYLGGATTGNIDFSGVTFVSIFEQGFGARWINAPAETKVQFKPSTRTFSGNDFVTLWVNGEKLYAGHVKADRDKVIDATLKPGWNAVVFKSNHVQWQWQFALEMAAADGSDLGGMKVSTVPK